MIDTTVRCGCGREMLVDSLRGRGAFRCGCGARVSITIPAPRSTQCVGVHMDEPCRLPVEITDPLPLCADHYTSTGLRQYKAWMSNRYDEDELARKITEHRYKIQFEAIEPEARDKYPELADEYYASRAKGVMEARYGAYATQQTDEERNAIRERHRTLDERKEREGVVYYIRSGEHVKIGTTQNLDKRLAAISAPNTELLATEPGYHKRERLLHMKFSKFRVNGEWFRLEPALVQYINSLRAQAGKEPITMEQRADLQ